MIWFDSHRRQRQRPPRSPSRSPPKSRRGTPAARGPSCPSARGTVSTKRSGLFCPPRGQAQGPPPANRHHEQADPAAGRAERPSPPSPGGVRPEFSTTSTWNIRGRHRIAAAASAVTPSQRAPFNGACATGLASIRASMSAGPSATPQTHEDAHPREWRKSLTTASTAMAETRPGCRSFRSSERVPKMIVNSRQPRPPPRSPSARHPAPPSAPGRAKAEKGQGHRLQTAARYRASPPATASTVTSAARPPDLP